MSMLGSVYTGIDCFCQGVEKNTCWGEGAYPPFSSVQADGTLVGFDIDIAKAICAEIGATCTLVPQDWDGIIPALLARKYDCIIASMSITEERKKKVAFSKKYYNTPAKFARKKGSGIAISKSGMKGKVVAVQRATTHDNFITAEFGDSVTIKRYGTQDEAYLDAVAGRVDLLLADSIAMDDGFLKTDKRQSDGNLWGQTTLTRNTLGKAPVLPCAKVTKNSIS